MTTSLFSVAVGIGNRDSKGNLLDAFYPAPEINVPTEKVQDLLAAVGFKGENISGEISADCQLNWPHYGFKEAPKLSRDQVIVGTVIARDGSPETTADAYLRLTLLSARLKMPHQVNVDGIFKVLPNVCWTSAGPISPEDFPQRQIEARSKGQPLRVWGIDKFPAMADYVVPGGIRIGDASRVRLGAYIGEGTTVMHEGFVNFNAGCEGPNMIEGRISAGVMVGKGSDLGGGCSTMGTLSGGGKTVNSIGERCLIGANAGAGIPLGNGCTIEAGLYLTAGTKVRLIAKDGSPSGTAKARDLAGKDDLLFRRNSLTGTVECLTQANVTELNEELHKHN